MFQIYLSNGWPDTHLSRAWVWIWTWLWAAVSDMSTPAWAEWPWPSHCSRCPWQQLPPCCFQCCWPSGHMAQGQGQTSVKDKVKQCQEWRDSQTAKCVCRQDVINVLSSSSAFLFCLLYRVETKQECGFTGKPSCPKCVSLKKKKGFMIFCRKTWQC